MHALSFHRKIFSPSGLACAVHQGLDSAVVDITLLMQRAWKKHKLSFLPP